jgi:N-acetylglucosamine kinase-like BadF-type ATPase
MSLSGHGARPLAVGVDLGASRLRLLATDGTRRWRIERAAPTPAELGKFLLTVWKKNGWRGRVRALVVAARGVWTPAERAALARRLRGLAPRIRVLADAQAALLGALPEGRGLLVLAGTGSIVVGRDRRGRWHRAGGLGPLLGDEGSGFWLAREWLRASPATAGRARRLAASPAPVARIAALAPVVLGRARRGDRRARRIVAAAQAHLARQAAAVARRLGRSDRVPVSWAGSLLADPWFRAGVARALARAGVRARWRAPAREPVEAAARLAAWLARPRASATTGRTRPRGRPQSQPARLKRR